MQLAYNIIPIDATATDTVVDWTTKTLADLFPIIAIFIGLAIAFYAYENVIRKR